jgi:hypothetical protein
MRKLFDPYWISVIFGGLVQLALFLRWLYRRIRNDELNRAFVQDMATNHLPHIYELLLKLCEKQGVDARDTVSIPRWSALSSSRNPHGTRTRFATSRSFAFVTSRRSA